MSDEAKSTPETPPLIPTLLLTASERPGIPPDPERDVFTCERNLRTARKRRAARRALERNALVRVLTVPAIFWVGLLLVGAFTLSGLAKGLGEWLTVAALIVMIGIFLGPMIWFLRRRKPPKSPDEKVIRLSPSPNPSYRLNMIGPKRTILAMRGLSAEPFEPRLIGIPFRLPTRKWPWVALWIVLAVSLGVAWWFVKRRSGVGLVFLPGNSLQAWEVWAIMGLAALPFAWLWPTYLRVSPGRLDVLVYGTLGAGPPKVTTIDLREARVECDASIGFITIDAPGRDRVTIQLSEWSGRWHEIMKSVLEAARWRGELLALPDDELVG